MQRKHSLAYYIITFIIIQLSSLSILGLWISRYVANHLVLKRIGEKFAIQMPYGGSVSILIIGLVLLVIILVGMSLLFRSLNFQYRQTRLYDNFISNITHELKTPIASIQLYTDTLITRDLTDEKRNHFLEQMQKDTDRLKKLVNVILDVSKLEQKKKVYPCEIYNTESLISDIIKKEKKIFGLNDDVIKIESSIESKCVCNKNAITSVFYNLIDNSLKYSEKSPRINIKFISNPIWSIIEYSDNGIGIPDKHIKNIFKRFHRINSPDIPNVKGTGLGLYLTKEILLYHGGKISVENFPDGNGLKFIIKLPKYNIIKKSYLKKLLRN